MNGSPENLKPARSRRYRIAWIVSVVAHVVLLAVAGTWYFNHRTNQTKQTAAATHSGSKAQPSPPAPSPEVTEKQVSATLQRTLEINEKKSKDEQLDLLDQKAQQLEQISSEQSVDEIAVKFHDWMDTQARASEPKKVDPANNQPPAENDGNAEPVERPKFDFDTAQIHEIRREESEDGYRYLTVLVDANGSTMESELHGEEGATAYATFERLKQFPLANQVYRKIAMPLMDKVLAAEKAAARAKAEGSPDKVDRQALPADVPTGEDERDPFDES